MDEEGINENLEGRGGGVPGVQTAMYEIPWNPGMCKLFRAHFQKPGALERHHKSVQVRIKKLKPRGAPGPDGLRKEHLRGMRGLNDLLAGLFNASLASNWYPTAWKKIQRQ